MNSYLEQGNYKRAQEFLNEFYTAQKTSKPNSSGYYRAVASQIVKSARDRVERYRALGLSVSDRTLPLEATNDLEKMRETLEIVITQSKDISKEKAKTADAMAMLEEASNSRSMLARDDYDAKRWRDEIADSREALANSRSVVLDASGQPMATQPGEYVAVSKTADQSSPAVNQPAGGNTASGTREREVNTGEPKITESTVAQNTKPVFVPTTEQSVIKEEPKPSVVQPNVQPAETKPAVMQPNVQPADTKPAVRRPNAQPNEPKPEVKQPNTQPEASTPAESGAPLDVGALTPYATSQPSPVYPALAKTTRTTGVVKVEVTVSENGDVTKVEKASGPPVLQAAAKDAIRKWKFKPFTRDGQPVKATGFVNFNFNL
jgi:TonB family protein